MNKHVQREKKHLDHDSFSPDGLGLIWKISALSRIHGSLNRIPINSSEMLIISVVCTVANDIVETKGQHFVLIDMW